MPREIPLERRCRLWTQDQGGRLLKFGGGAVYNKGLPDRIAFAPGGYTGVVEFKKPGEYPTKIQRHWLDEFAALGVPILVCTEFDQYKQWYLTELIQG